MPSRREFLQVGFAASMLPVVSVDRGRAAANRPVQAHHSVHALHAALCDDRFAQSGEFGVEAERLGVPVVRFAGDITDFWFTDLSLRWQHSPVAIAGLTAQGPLFCLERLAWDHGLRVVFRGTHRFADVHHVDHALAGPSGTLARAREFGLTGAQWARGVAQLVAACEAAGARSTAEMTAAAPDAGRREPGEPLVSWVIAPDGAGIAVS